MPAQALYLKWRPRSFDDVIGQEHITRTLRNALIQNRIRHAYLFNGPRGTGKTTMARILAKAVNCSHPDPAMRPCDSCPHCEAVNEGRYLDLIEIDAASHNGVDDVRDLREKIAFAPSEGKYKVYIIDEVHRFSGAAFDALLKTLEEPPDHAIFVLATTELDKVPATILSRSLLFQFRRVSVSEVAERLGQIAAEEGVQVERDVLELVASQGTGSVRDSISLLDQLIANPDETITLENAERALGTTSTRTVGRLVQAIVEGNTATGLDSLNQAIEDGADPAQLGRQIVEYLRNLLLVQTGGSKIIDTSEEQRTVFAQQSERMGRSALIRSVRAFNQAVNDMRSGWQPQLPLELALIESARPLPASTAQPETEPVAYRAETPPVPPSTPRQSAPPVAPAQRSAPQPVPPQSAPSTASHAPVPDKPVVRLADVRNAWPDLIENIRAARNVPLATLLQKASPQAIEGSTLVIAAHEAFVKQKLETDTNRTAFVKAIRAVLNVDMKIQIVAGSSGTSVKVDDTIRDDPLISQELQSGGRVISVDKLNTDTEGDNS